MTRFPIMRASYKGVSAIASIIRLKTIGKQSRFFDILCDFASFNKYFPQQSGADNDHLAEYSYTPQIQEGS